MNMPMCSRCKKNVAVVFITKIDQSNKSEQEGLCIKCAKEMGIKPIDNLMEQMGITDDDLEALAGEIGAFGDLSGLIPAGGEVEEELSDEGEEGTSKKMPFPFPLFGSKGSQKEDEEKQSKKTKEHKKDKKRKFLTNYCDDLTGKAKSGKIDKIIGRDRETERVIQILNRRQKNNPCLIGEPGVGKTAVAEGLALRIAQGKVPYKLRDKEIFMLDLTALVAGTQFRGQFESRMKGLIEEVKKLGNIILVIDEVHNIVGAGDSEGSMNAANILKPALSRGEIQVIGATTFNEYRKHIEKDSALERRFQPVSIEEPSLEDATDILMGIKSYYEDYHLVKISDAMCRQAVQLSERYITDRFLPDKAIDLIDEACSDLNLKNEMLSLAADIKTELKSVTMERESLMSDSSEGEELTSEQLDNRYEKIAQLRSKELQLESKLNEAEAAPRPVLTLDNLASVIELWTNIPASKVKTQEMQRLNEMEQRLKTRVIGQDEAIKAIAQAIRRNRAGISPKKKPVSFLFVGPTGVGKTELVKTLADDMFNSPEALIRLDMSEYMEKHTVARLIGSPPGYVGYDEAGQLTEKIRRRPYSVILMDEIEKAHPDVLNILLQILDDGRLTDAHGRMVNFENTIIVMTSNAGSGHKTSSLGFGKTASEQGKEKAMKALEDIMRPEFLNRIDEIVAFNQLSEEDFAKIAEILLGDLAKNLNEREIRMTYDESLIKYLTEKSYSLKFGARNLRRLIEKEVENALASEILSVTDKNIIGIHIKAENGELKLQSI